ncbi:MAG: alpha/beta hydrolase [Saprospiraceae bacterium]|nr:alpha/beta hydrolase [Lewinella sp.]
MKLPFLPISVFVLCLVSDMPVVSAQKAIYPVDSSYTVAGSYDKVKKAYPDIVVAEIEAGPKVVASINLTYKQVGQHELQLDIYSPKGKKNELRPAVLMIHGGGWASGARSHMEMMAKDLARHGYVGIPVSYRLSPEAQYPAGIEDLWDAITWIGKNGKKYRIDARQLFVLGASAGAQLATLLGTTENDALPYKAATTGKQKLIKGIINMDGIVSFIHPEANAEGSAASRWLGGGRETHWANWREASPLEYVDRHSPPILFINGSSPRFHAGRDDLIRHYDEHRIYHDTLEFEDAPHTFWFFYPWYEPMMDRLLSFLGRQTK